MQYKPVKSVVFGKKKRGPVTPNFQIRNQFRESDQMQKCFGADDQLSSTSLLAKEFDGNYRTIEVTYDLLEKNSLVKNEFDKSAEIRKRDTIAARKMSISFVTCRHEDEYLISVAEGIYKFAQEYDLNYNLINVGNSREQFIESVTNPGSDKNGILILPLERPGYAEAVLQAIENQMNIVLIDRELPGVDVSSVESDHFTGAYLATNHLLREHGRPVYFLGLVEKPSSCRDRICGWARAMDEYNFCDMNSYCFGLEVGEEELTAATDNGLKYDIEAAMRLFSSSEEDVYCIYAVNDYAARGIYAAAERLGLEIGKDVFVVGYNDMSLARMFHVPLSSIAQLPSNEAVGYEAAKLLYEQMTGLVQRSVRRLLPVELIVRESSTGRSE